ALGEVRDHAYERLVALGEVRHLRGPVVHLRVDVDGVLRLPRRRHLRVPDALKVRGLRAGARGGDEEVATELKIERREVRVFFAFGDRKSTRLNSSHSQISYAVFCSKKKINPPASSLSLPGRTRLVPIPRPRPRRASR